MISSQGMFIVDALAVELDIEVIIPVVDEDEPPLLIMPLLPDPLLLPSVVLVVPSVVDVLVPSVRVTGEVVPVLVPVLGSLVMLSPIDEVGVSVVGWAVLVPDPDPSLDEDIMLVVEGAEVGFSVVWLVLSPHPMTSPSALIETKPA